MTKIVFFILCSLTVNSFAFTLSSPAFTPNTNIPTQYTCEGANISPPLSWQGAPENTQSFVLILEDPTAPAGTWTHWVLYNIPANLQQLAEATPIPAGSSMGMNSWGNPSYEGPCPPSGQHRYYFKLYALDTQIDVKDHIDTTTLVSTIKPHIIGTAELLGLYSKKTQ